MDKKEYTEEMVRLIIEGAIQEEREAIAKMIEEEDEYGFKDLARRIRARGQEWSVYLMSLFTAWYLAQLCLVLFLGLSAHG